MGIQHLSNRNKFVLLIVLMALTAIAVAGMTLAVLYQTSYREQSNRLEEIVKSKARYIEKIAQTNLLSNNRHQAYLATIEQIQKAQSHFTEDGGVGHISVAKTEHNNIVFLVLHPSSGESLPKTIPLTKDHAVPIKRALSGRSGVTTDFDYRGVKVLAAYEPIAVFGWGITASVDYSDLQAPFIRAGLHSAVLGAVVILLGAWSFQKISGPLIISVEQTESQLQTILNTVVDGIVSTDAAGKILTFNTSAEAMFGYQAKEVIGSNVNILIPSEFHQSHTQLMKNYNNHSRKKTIGINREVYGKRKSGVVFPIEIALGEAHIGNKNVFTAVIRDITDRRQAEEELKKYREALEEQVAQRTAALQQANRKLEQLAREDALTGIANRRVFDEVLSQEIRRAHRNAKPLSLIICDIDFFKKYNDTYGHLAGDKCLQSVAKTIQNAFQRAGELVARYGGEEFAIILPLLEKQAAVARAENLRMAIWDLAIPHTSSKIAGRLSISLGVAAIDGTSHVTLQQLIHAADTALYKAKSLGRNRVEADT